MKSIRCIVALSEVVILVVGLFETPLPVQPKPNSLDFEEFGTGSIGASPGTSLAPLYANIETNSPSQEDITQPICVTFAVESEHQKAKLSTELNRQYAEWQKTHGIDRYLGRVISSDKQVEVCFTMADEASADAITVVIESMGGEVITRDGRWLVAWVPIGQFENLAAQPDVYFMQSARQANRPDEFMPSDIALQPRGCQIDGIPTACVQSEGVKESGADLWHANGWTGQGVKIAIFDTFNNYEKSRDNGELPEPHKIDGCEVKTDPNNSTKDHGVFVAEIIHDMAPDAQLAFVTPVKGWKYCLEQVTKEGYDIINISLAAFFGETPGDGVPDSELDWVKGMEDAFDKGATITFSAGNDNLAHWNGDYKDSGFEGWHTFEKEGTNFNSFDVYESNLVNRLGKRTIYSEDLSDNPFDDDPLGNGKWFMRTYVVCGPRDPITDSCVNPNEPDTKDPDDPKSWKKLAYYLRWNDWNKPRNGNENHVDYKLYLKKWNGQKWVDADPVTKDGKSYNPYSEEDQANSNIIPVDRLVYYINSTGEYGIAIQRIHGNGSHHLDFHSYMGPNLEINIRKHSLMDGATLPYVLGVGALDLHPEANNPNWLLPKWNSPVIPVLAPYSSWGPILGSGGVGENLTTKQPFITGYADPRFFGGTSAAAPHVAGAAAVLQQAIKSAFPDYKSKQIQPMIADHLSANAKDVGPAGYDYAYGYGLLNLGTPPEPEYVTVTKTSNPTIIAPGDEVTYMINVVNTTLHTVNFIEVIDDKFGDISPNCFPRLPATLAPNGTLSCTLTRAVQGPSPHVNTVTVKGIYNQYNPVKGIASASVIVDMLPPTSSISLKSVPGKNDWFISDVEVSITAQDDVGGSGVCSIEWSMDSGSTWSLYASPFIHTAEGTFHLMSRATDCVGNVEDPATEVVFKVDKTPPVVDVWTDQTEYTRIQPFVIHYSGYDPDPGSGLASLTGMFSGRNVTDGQVIDLFWLPLAEYTLSVSGEDYAGWKTTESTSIQIVATMESLQGTVQRLCQEHYITKNGICKSLLRKLNSALAAQARGQNKTAANILYAFQNEVRAQTGKSIKPEASTIMIMDSNYLIQRPGRNAR